MVYHYCMPTTHTSPLPDRALLAVTGPQALTFLNGVLTNDLTKLTPQNAMYAAHLTPQGRFLYDVFVLKAEGDTLWLDCHKESLLPLAKALHGLRTNEALTFDDLSDDYTLYAQWGNLPTKPLGQRWQEGAIHAYADPRLANMGWRLIAPHNKPITTNASFDTYTAHRLTLAVPDGAYDALPGKTLPNELCLADLNGISYSKGCYVGQEVTARTHFRTPPKKRLMYVTFDGPAPAPGTELTANGKEAGHMGSHSGQQGLAVVRLNEAQHLLHAGLTKIVPTAPEWADYTLT